MSAVREIRVPDIGDFKDVPVIEIFIKPGDIIAQEDMLITLESDKATVDVPSPSAGTVKSVHVALGDRVSKGAVVVVLDEIGSSETGDAAAALLQISAPSPVSAPQSVTALRQPAPAPQVQLPASTPWTIPATQLVGTHGPRASPSLRRFAREFGVDLSRVTATGPKGRILREDLQSHIKRAMAQSAGGKSDGSGSSAGLNLLAWPQIDFAKFGSIERSALSKIKKISGANLTRNAVLIPHVTNFEEADVTELEAFRATVNKEVGSKITMLAFLIKASVATLKQFPTFNASLDGEDLILKRYFHIGFAADTPSGLVVPVIFDVDQKGILDIAAEAGKLSALARDGKIKLADMQGGCFTISSLGGIGGRGFTPIINAPEVAILGAARAQMKPIWDGKQFMPRLIMPMSLSWDHRVIDGAAAARFLVALSTLLADFRRIAL